MPEGLDPRHEFTKLHINSGNSSFDITVVGSPDIVEEKLAAKNNSLLKGQKMIECSLRQMSEYGSLLPDRDKRREKVNITALNFIPMLLDMVLRNGWWVFILMLITVST